MDSSTILFIVIIGGIIWFEFQYRQQRDGTLESVKAFGFAAIVFCAGYAEVKLLNHQAPFLLLIGMFLYLLFQVFTKTKRKS